MAPLERLHATASKPPPPRCKSLQLAFHRPDELKKRGHRNLNAATASPCDRCKLKKRCCQEQLRRTSIGIARSRGDMRFPPEFLQIGVRECPNANRRSTNRAPPTLARRCHRPHVPRRTTDRPPVDSATEREDRV